MQVDYLASRLDRLKLSSQQIAALAEIRARRLRALSELQFRQIAKERFIDDALQAFKKRERPFQNCTLLESLDWKRCSEVIRKLLRDLARAGLRNGSLQALARDVEANYGFAFDLCQAALDSRQERLFSLAAKYNIEPDLLRFIIVTPLVPVFHRLQALLPRQENPVPMTACPLCGASSNGVYQAGYRFVICPVCNHRVRIDSFLCARCGNTEPQEMGFVTSKAEPLLQIDYCLKCNSYFKILDHADSYHIQLKLGILDFAECLSDFGGGYQERARESQV